MAGLNLVLPFGHALNDLFQITTSEHAKRIRQHFSQLRQVHALLAERFTPMFSKRLDSQLEPHSGE